MKKDETSEYICRRAQQAAETLAEETDALTFGGRTAFIYNPLKYAWGPHAEYIRRYGNGRKRVIFVGMNPGPWGMAQTGVPFGEINMVRSWLNIGGVVDPPADQHPKKPIRGFDCSRSEVSGRRLWGLMRDRFHRAENFFSSHFVVNYCPLIFLEDSGRNLTPDKLSASERDTLFACCDRHLIALTDIYQPEYVIGVGKFAERRAEKVLSDRPDPPKVDSILHPSPASPMANRGWAEQASLKLESIGVWNMLPGSEIRH